MKKSNLKWILNPMSDNEKKLVKGGSATQMQAPAGQLDYGEGSKPCPAPKRPCNGPAGTLLPSGGICCLGPWGPYGWFGTYCYAELQGMNKCP